MVNLENLNESQFEVVKETDGPIMVLAGAGSGKTRTLVTRISYILENMNISPFRLLALTFSNKAAKEMRDRIGKMVSSDIGALQITTFHAFCARVLRSEANFLGLSKNFTIYDTSESKSVVKNVLGRRGISTKEVSPFEVLYFIDQVKNFGHYAGRVDTDKDYEIDKDDDFYQYYLEYEEELHRANALDFGGLITGVIQLFEKYPEVLERYQERFQYVLVDEYQDTNRAQFELIKMLTEKNRNVCVVGDEDQSIYSWRGADIRNILDFEETFPDAKVLKLEQNYRSSKNIIEAASCVIARNEMRKGKEMWTNNPRGEDIKVHEAFNDKKEAEYIGEEIKKLKKEGVSLDDIAVFYRTNSQSRLIEDYLRKINIHYRVVGGVRFYERKEIKDLLAYLRIVINPKDSLALSRIINVPARGIGATSLRKLEDAAVQSNMSLLEVLDDFSDNPENYSHIRMSAKVKSSLRFLSSLLGELRVINEQGEKPSVIYQKVLHESGYWDFLKANKDYESQARMENLMELESAIIQYEETQENSNLTGFLETITLDSNSDDGDSIETGEVSLMTVHGAKGLEFSYVFVSGAEENIFPSYRSLEDPDGQGVEEERRLFYVAMTRAMVKLYITFAQGRMLFGQLKFNGPSRFIMEIPDKFYVWEKEGGSKASGDNYFSDGMPEYDDFSQESPDYFDEDVVIQVEPKKSTYPEGSKIVHSLYGEGKVIENEGTGSEEKVVIKFNDGTKKKFMVKFAPISLI